MKIKLPLIMGLLTLLSYCIPSQNKHIHKPLKIVVYNDYFDFTSNDILNSIMS